MRAGASSMSTRDFTSTYDRNVARVYGFFAYVVHTRADAEDLTQQTFERAMRAWERFDSTRASASTWLLAIARNLLIDHLRTAGAVRTEALDEVGLEELVAPEDRHSLGLEPDLEQALAQLGHRERELIALRFGGDLTGPEIASLTGLTTGNVQQILSRALRRMRASMDRVPVGT
jgi:RNA polymerase sigma factor (sigma-70 family)